MNTSSINEKFINVRVLLDSVSSSPIVVIKLTSNIKTKEAEKLRGKPKPVSS